MASSETKFLPSHMLDLHGHNIRTHMDQPIPQGLDIIDSQIVEFIASGTPAVEVASMIGVSISVVQEKIKALRELIQARGKEVRNVRVEQKYATTEEKILNRIQKEAEDDLTDVVPLIRALEVIAKNRVIYRNPTGLGAPAQMRDVNIINLHLPAAASIAPNVTLNSQAEIIAVGKRNMASMPIEGVQDLFAKLDTQYQQQHQEKTNANSQDTTDAELVPETAST